MIDPKRRMAIRAALRKLWLWSPERTEALRRARGKPKSWGWLCAQCNQFTQKPQVDHIVPVGPTPGAKGSEGVTWEAFLDRLFCGADGLRVVCGPCHLQITDEQRSVSENPKKEPVA